MSFEEKMQNQCLGQERFVGSGQYASHGEAGQPGNPNAATAMREQSVMDAILMREIRLQSQLEGLKQLRRSLSIDVLEGPVSRLDAIFRLRD